MKKVNFSYSGCLSSSKSLYIRALFIKSFAPDKINIKAKSAAQDVLATKAALKPLLKKTHKHPRVFNAGDSGALFRFLALRLSRERGEFMICGSEALLKRPHQDLISILEQFKVKAKLIPNQGLWLASTGWAAPSSLKVPGSISSQFFSAVLLSAWQLDFPLKLLKPKSMVSEPYLKMTLDLCRKCGMKIKANKTHYLIEKKQKPRAKTLTVEMDMSSAAALSALAALCGKVKLRPFNKKSLQPDVIFLEFFKQMGIPVHYDAKKKILSVRKGPPDFNPLRTNIASCPDLFPVLCALAVRGKGQSVIDGAPQLRHKESDRIFAVMKILKQLNISHRELKGGLIIEGKRPPLKQKMIAADTFSDHRLVMMIALLRAQGFLIEAKNPEVVDKSFPEFKKIAKEFLSPV